MTKALKHMTSSERFQHEIDKIDRRIMNPDTTPEEARRLMAQRKRLFAEEPYDGSLPGGRLDADNGGG